MDRFDERLLQPVEAYNNAYKSEFLKNAEDLFNSLTEKSKVNVEMNRKTVAKYKELCSQLDNLTSILKKNKRLRTLAIITGIIIIAISCYIVYDCSENGSFTTANIFMAIGFALVGLLFIIFCNKTLKQAVQDSQSKVSEKEEEAEEVMALADRQMEPLNSLFDTHMTFDLMEKTVPMLNFDYQFTYERFEKLNQRYGFYANLAVNKSTLGIISGEINGNPFVINQNMVQSFQNATYTGSLDIHWTTQERDSEGHWQTVYHHETLYASVLAPKPCYDTQTMLIYCNDAAPDLSFTRRYSHIERLSDSKLKHFINNKKRMINRQQKKAIKGEGTFTVMSNNDFDAVFGALDRDNEVQFRLMYTPLAQNNTMSLLRDSENYGDDFNFVKRGTINLM